MIDNSKMLRKIETRLVQIGKSKGDLYSATGISRQMYYLWRNGKAEPYDSTLTKIADFLGVTVDWLKKEEEIALPGDLSLDEKLIISLYRQCSDEEKASIGAFLTQLRSAPVLSPEEIANKQST